MWTDGQTGQKGVTNKAKNRQDRRGNMKGKKMRGLRAM